MDIQPPEVKRIIRDFNKYLADREVTQMVEMARRWGQVEDNLRAQISNIALTIAERQAQGLAVGDTAITRLAAYRDMLGQIAREANSYEQYAARVISAEQLAYGQAGLDAATSALRSGVGAGTVFNRVNVEAVQNMVGLTGDGSPLFSVLQKRALAPDMAAGLTRNLIEAVSLGYSAKKTADMMADGLSDGLTKALVIARTEQIRVYREATLAQYKKSGIVKQYQRHAAPSERTCLACLALDGKIYNVEAEVDSHPQCRCFITPLIPGFTPPASASGETWLAKQDEQTQRNILGGHYDLYKSGTPLGDMVKIKQDKTWGPTVGVRPLKEMAGAGKAAKVVPAVPLASTPILAPPVISAPVTVVPPVSPAGIPVSNAIDFTKIKK